MIDFACGTGGFITSWMKALKPKVNSTEAERAIGESVYGIEKKQFPYMLCVTNLLLHDVQIPRVYHDNSLTRDVQDYTDDERFDVILMNPPYGGSEKSDIQNHFPKSLASSETADLFVALIMYRLKQGGRAAVILPDGFLFGTDGAKLALKKKLLSEFNLHTVIRLPSGAFAPYTSITTNILFFDNCGATKETWFYRVDVPNGWKSFSKGRMMTAEHLDCAREWWHNREELYQDDMPKAKKFTSAELTETLGYNLDQCGYAARQEEIRELPELLADYEATKRELDDTLEQIMGFLSAYIGGEDA